MAARPAEEFTRRVRAGIIGCSHIAIIQVGIPAIPARQPGIEVACLAELKQQDKEGSANGKGAVVAPLFVIGMRRTSFMPQGTEEGFLAF